MIVNDPLMITPQDDEKKKIEEFDDDGEDSKSDVPGKNGQDPDYLDFDESIADYNRMHYGEPIEIEDDNNQFD